MKHISFASFANKNLYEMSKLGAKKLSEPHRKRGEEHEEYLRGDTFLRMYKNSEEFTKIDGTKVTLNVDEDILNTLEAMKQNRNYDAIGKLTFTTNNNENIKITALAKDQNFGGGSAGQGGGSEQTSIMEATQCWYCAAAFDDYPLGQHGENTFGGTDKKIGWQAGYNELQTQLASIKDEIKGTAVDPAELHNKKWTLTFTNTANALASHFKIQKNHFEFHHGSDVVKHIMGLFSLANKNSGKTFGGKDKWNPADIWIVKKGKAADILAFGKQKDLTFEILNAKMLEWYHNQDLVGVSLKQLSDNGHVAIYNDSEERLEVEFDDIYSTGKNLASNKDVQLKLTAGTKYFTITFRTFGTAAASWCGEVNGKAAQAGKVGTGAVINALKNVGYDIRLKQVATMSKDAMVSEILQLNKTLHFKEDPADAEAMMRQEPQWLYSKVLGMRLGVFFQTHTDKVNQFCHEVFHYASSSHSSSSVFLKVS